MIKQAGNDGQGLNQGFDNCDNSSKGLQLFIILLSGAVNGTGIGRLSRLSRLSVRDVECEMFSLPLSFPLKT